MPGWTDLNKRQQTYLQSVYEVDQLQEANIKAMATRGRWNRTPASEWRWMPYNASGAALLHRIQGLAIVTRELVRRLLRWNDGAW
jgi:hypothetical protein